MNASLHKINYPPPVPVSINVFKLYFFIASFKLNRDKEPTR